MKNYLLEYLISKNNGNKTKTAESIGMKRARFNNFSNNGRPLKDWQIIHIKSKYPELTAEKIMELIQKTVKERNK